MIAVFKPHRLKMEESPGSRKQGAERKLGTGLRVNLKLGQYRATETMSVLLP